ncbi:hypothetical protein CIHG_06810 [Coccidioides immitis H538.4]|uniref:Secreted protein n=1 Tax=Coccidioides immitis H538.4 TaxID=396776 RepID=A0A0J8RXT8_COCIT|nr:hypothetical protein CIHG_06810 [Coccidioides immitis H538.4]
MPAHERLCCLSRLHSLLALLFVCPKFDLIVTLCDGDEAPSCSLVLRPRPPAATRPYQTTTTTSASVERLHIYPCCVFRVPRDSTYFLFYFLMSRFSPFFFFFSFFSRNFPFTSITPP